jgi:hypothetical protein
VAIVDLLARRLASNYPSETRVAAGWHAETWFMKRARLPPSVSQWLAHPQIQGLERMLHSAAHQVCVGMPATFSSPQQQPSADRAVIELPVGDLRRTHHLRADRNERHAEPSRDIAQCRIKARSLQDEPRAEAGIQAQADRLIETQRRLTAA